MRVYKHKEILLIITGIIVMASTCRKKNDECPKGNHNGITVQNKSSKRINFEIYWNYPDTLIGEYNPKGFGVIKPDSFRIRGAGPNSCWEEILKGGKKQYLYIFDEDSLEVIPWETVRLTNRGLIERKEISLQYLIENNFTLTYP